MTSNRQDRSAAGADDANPPETREKGQVVPFPKSVPSPSPRAPRPPDPPEPPRAA